MVNRDRLIALLRKLISIDSSNPTGDEYEIASFVKEYFVRLGLNVKIIEFKKRRSNVIAVLKGLNSTKSLLVTPHLDTVPAGRGWAHDPFKGRIAGGKIFGLGATDCKGNLAAGMEAIHSLVEDKKVLNYNLIFAATADEESGSHFGLIPLLNRNMLKADAAVVLDLDDFGIMVAQKGLMHIKVKIWGRRAHGAYPWLGVNAIDIALKALSDIKKYRFQVHKNKFLKQPTINIGTINGGDKVNVVADWCEFELDIRSLPQERQDKILKEIKQILSRYAAKFKVEIEGIQRPYLIDSRHPLVDSLRRAIKKAGVNPRIVGCEGATVVTFFQDKSIPAIATGFGVEGCDHLSNEYIRIANLYKGAKVVENFISGFKFN